MERVAGGQDVPFDEAAVALVRKRVPPVIDVKEDVGVDLGMAMVGDRVLGEGRVGLGRELGRDLAEHERQGGQGQPGGGDDPSVLFHAPSFGAGAAPTRSVKP